MTTFSRIAAIAVVALTLLVVCASAQYNTTGIVPTNFFEFVQAGCPPGLVADDQEGTANKYRNRYCCQFYPEATPNKGKKYCGDKVLKVSGAGTFQCKASAGAQTLNCCSRRSANGAIVSTPFGCGGLNGAMASLSAAVMAGVMALLAFVGGL